MALPFVITRVETAAATLVTWKTIVYFAGAYVIGVFAGLRYEAFLSWISAVKWPLAIVLILSTALLWPLSLQDSDQWHGIALRESLFYAQKLSLGGLILLQLRAWVTSSRPGWVSPLLGGVADVSYPLYFYHAAISLVVAAVLQQFAPAHSTYLFAVPAFILGFIGTTALTWAAILIIKAPLGRASKYILGAA
jgi:hypothetical protein